MPPDRKKKYLTLEQRVDALELLDSGRSMREVAAELGVGKTQIFMLKINRDLVQKEWENGGRAEQKTVKRRKSTYEDVNQAVWEWFCSARSKNIPVTGRLIQEKALMLSVEFGHDDFTASNGWLEAWRMRHHVKFSTLSAMERSSKSVTTGYPVAGSTPKMRTRLSTGTLIMNGTYTESVGSAKAGREPGGLAMKRKWSLTNSSESPVVPVAKQCKLVPQGREARQNDAYCWLCHKEKSDVFCELCPRGFHLKCLSVDHVANDWACGECQKSLQAECTDTSSNAMKQIDTDTLCLLLRYALDRMKQPESEMFQKPVEKCDFNSYYDIVKHPMDFTVLEQNIKKKEYGSTEAFLSDAKWILHNCILFNGAQHKLTSVARIVIKSCMHEMSEIEVCPQCYRHSCIMDGDWFIKPCDPPHSLVWAKLKGHPFWPAKAMREVNGLVDVRFFGAHDMALVPKSHVFHFSKDPPTAMKKKKKGFDLAMKEVAQHIKLLSENFGQYEHASFRTPYDRRQVYFTKKLKLVTTMAAKRLKSATYGKQGHSSKVNKTVSALKMKYSSLTNRKVVAPNAPQNTVSQAEVQKTSSLTNRKSAAPDTQLHTVQADAHNTPTSAKGATVRTVKLKESVPFLLKVSMTDVQRKPKPAAGGSKEAAGIPGGRQMDSRYGVATVAKKSHLTATAAEKSPLTATVAKKSPLTATTAEKSPLTATVTDMSHLTATVTDKSPLTISDQSMKMALVADTPQAQCSDFKILESNNKAACEVRSTKCLENNDKKKEVEKNKDKSVFGSTQDCNDVCHSSDNDLANCPVSDSSGLCQSADTRGISSSPATVCGAVFQSTDTKGMTSRQSQKCSRDCTSRVLSGSPGQTVKGSAVADTPEAKHDGERNRLDQTLGKKDLDGKTTISNSNTSVLITVEELQVETVTKDDKVPVNVSDSAAAHKQFSKEITTVVSEVTEVIAGEQNIHHENTIAKPDQFKLVPVSDKCQVSVLDASVVDAVAPSVVDTVAPSVVDTVAPSVVDTVAPSVVDTVAPSVVDTVAPSVASMKNSSTSSHLAPEISEVTVDNNLVSMCTELSPNLGLELRQFQAKIDSSNLSSGNQDMANISGVAGTLSTEDSFLEKVPSCDQEKVKFPALCKPDMPTAESVTVTSGDHSVQQATVGSDDTIKQMTVTHNVNADKQSPGEFDSNNVEEVSVGNSGRVETLATPETAGKRVEQQKAGSGGKRFKQGFGQAKTVATDGQAEKQNCTGNDEDKVEQDSAGSKGKSGKEEDSKNDKDKAETVKAGNNGKSGKEAMPAVERCKETESLFPTFSYGESPKTASSSLIESSTHDKNKKNLSMRPVVEVGDDSSACEQVLSLSKAAVKNQKVIIMSPEDIETVRKVFLTGNKSTEIVTKIGSTTQQALYSKLVAKSKTKPIILKNTSNSTAQNSSLTSTETEMSEKESPFTVKIGNLADVGPLKSAVPVPLSETLGPQSQQLVFSTSTAKKNATIVSTDKTVRSLQSSVGEDLGSVVSADKSANVEVRTLDSTSKIVTPLAVVQNADSSLLHPVDPLCGAATSGSSLTVTTALCRSAVSVTTALCRSAVSVTTALCAKESSSSAGRSTSMNNVSPAGNSQQTRTNILEKNIDKNRKLSSDVPFECIICSDDEVVETEDDIDTEDDIVDTENSIVNAEDGIDNTEVGIVVGCGVTEEQEYDSLIIDLDENDFDLVEIQKDKGSEAVPSEVKLCTSRNLQAVPVMSPQSHRTKPKHSKSSKNSLSKKNLSKNSLSTSKKKSASCGASASTTYRSSFLPSDDVPSSTTALLDISTTASSVSLLSTTSSLASECNATTDSIPCIIKDVRSLQGTDCSLPEEDRVGLTSLPSITSLLAKDACLLSEDRFRVTGQQISQSEKTASPTQDEDSPQEAPALTGTNQESLDPLTVSLVTKYSQQLLGNLQKELSEMCKELLSTTLKRQDAERELRTMKEQLEWQHEQQVSEIQHSFKMTLAEMKATLEAEKATALADLRGKLQKEKDDAVGETKKKQWCSQCWKEALYYCCWNTSYCSYACQEKHWGQHQASCRQTQDCTADTSSASPVVVTSRKAHSGAETTAQVQTSFSVSRPPQGGPALVLQTMQGSSIGQPLQQYFNHGLQQPFSATQQVQLLMPRSSVNTASPPISLLYPQRPPQQPQRSGPPVRNLVLNRPMHFPQLWNK